MSSYLITGASRGLGFEFVRQLSANPKNIVVGLVRDKASTDKKVKDLNRGNIHIVQADMSDYISLKATVDQITPLVNGSLDYIIANAALISKVTAYNSFGSLRDEPEILEDDLLQSFRVNAVGNVHLFNLFIPLVLKGKAKKVISISTGLADDVVAARYELDTAGSYSISKIAMNMVVAKFSAEYAKQGVLFLSISPGVVNTQHGLDTNLTEAQVAKMQEQGQAFMKYAPNFRGMIEPDESVSKVLKVIDAASLEGGYAGAFISHFGNKQWI